MDLAFAGDLTKVTTTPEYPLGTRCGIPASNMSKAAQYQTADRGDSEWVYVYNDSGSDLVVGELIARKTAAGAYAVRQAPANCPKPLLVGVCVKVIPDGYYGWVQCKGFVYGGVVSMNADFRDRGLFSGAVAGRAYLASAAVTDAERGPFGLGIVNNAAGAAGARIAAYIDCPGA